MMMKSCCFAPTHTRHGPSAKCNCISPEPERIASTHRRSSSSHCGAQKAKAQEVLFQMLFLGRGRGRRVDEASLGGNRVGNGAYGSDDVLHSPLPST